MTPTLKLLLVLVGIVVALIPLTSYARKNITPNFKPLSETPHSEDYEITRVYSGNSTYTKILYDTKNNHIIIVGGTSPYDLIKLNMSGEIIDTWSNKFDELFNHPIPILTQRYQGVYFDWINTGDKTPHPYQVLNSDEKIKKHEWEKTFLALYSQAEHVHYAYENRYVFEKDGEWIELNSLADRFGYTEYSIKQWSDRADAEVKDFPEKWHPQILRLKSILDGKSVTFDYEKSLPGLKLVKFEKISNVLADSPIPLPPVVKQTSNWLGRTVYGKGYYEIEIQQQKIGFSLTTMLYPRKGYEVLVTPYYPVDSTPENTKMILLKVKNQDKAIDGIYVVRKKKPA